MVRNLIHILFPHSRDELGNTKQYFLIPQINMITEMPEIIFVAVVAVEPPVVVEIPTEFGVEEIVEFLSTTDVVE